MRIVPFRLEQFLGRHELATRHVLGASDPEPVRMQALLDMADEECLGLWQNLRLGYTDSNGLPLLRTEIAATYDRVDPGEVLVTAGAGEAITLTLAAILEPGDHVVVVTPAYQSLMSVPMMFGARVTQIRLEPDNGWLLDVDAVRKAARTKTRAIVVNFPHNPSGALPDSRTQQDLIEIADNAGSYLLSDEVYRGLEHDPRDRWPAAVDLSTRAISIGVMTKAYGLAGLRIGWLACRDAALMRGVAMAKDYASICNSAPSEVLSTIALRNREALLDRVRSAVAGNLDLLADFLDRYDDVFDWHPPRATTMAFVRLVGRALADDVASDLIAERGVLLVPGSVYGRSDHLRFGLGRDDFRLGLDRLAAYVNDHRSALATR